MDRNITRILQDLANSAAAAADEARAAARSAGRAVTGKYDEMRTGIELTRLENEQENTFTDIGRMLFWMHTGDVAEQMETADGLRSPRQIIDALLVKAEQAQQQIDIARARLEEEKKREGEKVCPCCGRLCDERDAFCSVCGTRLDEKPAGTAQA